MIIIDKTDVREAKKMGETYGWLFRGGVNDAGKRLSYESFKWYVDLALNQDGYHCKDQIPDDVADELYKYGYLTFSRGETHFNEWGNDVTATNTGADHNYQSRPSPEPQRVADTPVQVEYIPPSPEERFMKMIIEAYIDKGYKSPYDMAVVLRESTDSVTISKINEIWQEHQDYIMGQWSERRRQDYEMELARDELPW